MRADKLTKALGQHILINPGIIDTVLKKCEISFCYSYNYNTISLIVYASPEDTVLEVGSGTGNLTAKLSEKFNHIVLHTFIEYRLVLK